MAIRGPERLLPTKAEVRALLVRYRATGSNEIRDELTRIHQNLVIYLARKFRDRGEPLDDLIQVAQIGLLTAIARYDPARGTEFSTFATPTIVGEIKRHFRDKLWAIQVPRRLRERNYSLMRALEGLSLTLGRSPTISELADATHAAFDDVLEAMEVGRAYHLVSLDAEASDTEEDATLGELVGAHDPQLESLEDRATLEWALGRLSERSREIVRLRFYEDLSQSEIARSVGISQMHTSRLLRKALLRLRFLIAGRLPPPD